MSSFSSFGSRDSSLIERMDDPHCDKKRLFKTYQHFKWMNPILGNWSAITSHLILPFLKSQSIKKVRILDIGCGGGDVLIAMYKKLIKVGFEVEALGIDPDINAQEFRNEAVKNLPGLSFRCGWSHDIKDKFDLIISNHVLHHLNEKELSSLKNECERLSDGLVLLNDLRRSAIAYSLYSAIAWPLHLSSFAWIDGRISIRRAYDEYELNQLFGSPWEILSHGLFRLLVAYNAKK